MNNILTVFKIISFEAVGLVLVLPSLVGPLKINPKSLINLPYLSISFSIREQFRYSLDCVEEIKLLRTTSGPKILL